MASVWKIKRPPIRGTLAGARNAASDVDLVCAIRIHRPYSDLFGDIAHEGNLLPVGPPGGMGIVER